MKKKRANISNCLFSLEIVPLIETEFKQVLSQKLNILHGYQALYLKEICIVKSEFRSTLAILTIDVLRIDSLPILEVIIDATTICVTMSFMDVSSGYN